MDQRYEISFSLPKPHRLSEINMGIHGKDVTSPATPENESDQLTFSSAGQPRGEDMSVSADVPLSSNIASTSDNKALDKFGLFVSSKLPKHVLSADDWYAKYVLFCTRTYASLWKFQKNLRVVDLRVTVPTELVNKLSSNTKFHVTLLQQAFNALRDVSQVDTLLLPILAAKDFNTLKDLLSALSQLSVRISSLVLHLSTIPNLSSSEEPEMSQLLKSSRISHLEIVCSTVRQDELSARKLVQLVQKTVQVSYKATECRPFFNLEEKNDADDGDGIPEPEELLRSLNFYDSAQPSAAPHPIQSMPYPKTSLTTDSTYMQKSKLSDGDSYASTIWNLERLHKSGYNGVGTTIAVLDTGIHYIHPAFKGKISRVRNFVPNDELNNLECVIDSDGHGSLCAGIAAGASFKCPHDCSDNNSTEILVPPGIAPGANLVICKVVGVSCKKAKKSVVAAALEWLKELHQTRKENIDVISISLASSCFLKNLTKLISELTTMGVIIVCCASNEGRMRFQPISFPGRLGNVLCIGAHNYNGKPTSFSPVGKELDFLAPGSEVGGPGPGTNGPFAMDFASGTSLATPAAAGLVSLILDRFKKMSKDDPMKFQLYNCPVAKHVNNCWIMRELIKEMSSSPGHHSEEIGYGTIDPYRLLDRSNDELFRLVKTLVKD